jgi:hypothetical protein
LLPQDQSAPSQETAARQAKLGAQAFKIRDKDYWKSLPKILAKILDHHLTAV